MDKLAIEDGGAVSVRGEKVDQHDDLHLVVEGEPPVGQTGCLIFIWGQVLSYQARKKSVKVSMAVKSANTIQYIIHLTYLGESIIQNLGSYSWYAVFAF